MFSKISVDETLYYLIGIKKLTSKFYVPGTHNLKNSCPPLIRPLPPKATLLSDQI